MNSPSRHTPAIVAACAFAILAAVLCLLGAPSVARADGREVMAYSLDASGNRTDYYTTDDAIKAGYSGKVIYLDCDWVFSGMMTVADSQALVIDMNGHLITSQGYGAVINLKEHSNLTLQCSQPTAAATFTFKGYDENDKNLDRTITSGGLITGGAYYEYSTTSNNIGGGFLMDAGSTLTLDNVAVAGNQGSCSGGIYAKKNCTVNIKNGAVVEYNCGSSAGGIIFAGEECNLNMDNGSIVHNNGGNNAGGVEGKKDGLRIKMENGSCISNNTGSTGGGIRFEGSWYYVISSDRTGRIENNNAKHPHYSGTDAYGGGIHVAPNSSDSCEGRIEGLTISGNYSKSSGGGIDLKQNNARIIDCTITNNTTDGKGGGVNLRDNMYCSLEGCTVTGNKSEGLGGGVYVSKNIGLAGACTVKDNKSGNDFATSDDLYISEGANFYGEVDAGSCVYLRCSKAEKRMIGWDLTFFADGTYFSDYDGYYIYKGAGGVEAWMFPICKSPKFTLTVTRPTAGQTLSKTAKFTWSDESWEYFDYGIQWVDEDGNLVDGVAELGKKYRAYLCVLPYDGCGFTLPETLSADDVSVLYADDTSVGPFRAQDAHVGSDGYLNISTDWIDAITDDPQGGGGDDVRPDEGGTADEPGAGAETNRAGVSGGSGKADSGIPKTGDASAPATEMAVAGGAAALIAVGAAALKRREH